MLILDNNWKYLMPLSQRDKLYNGMKLQNRISGHVQGIESKSNLSQMCRSCSLAGMSSRIATCGPHLTLSLLVVTIDLITSSTSPEQAITTGRETLFLHDVHLIRYV